MYAVQKFATLNGNVEWTNSILKYRDIHRPFACSISLTTKKHERHDERENEIELERRIYAVCKWRRRSRRKTIDDETIKRVDTLYSCLSAILSPSRPLSLILCVYDSFSWLLHCRKCSQFSYCVVIFDLQTIKTVKLPIDSCCFIIEYLLDCFLRYFTYPFERWFRIHSDSLSMAWVYISITGWMTLQPHTIYHYNQPLLMWKLRDAIVEAFYGRYWRAMIWKIEQNQQCSSSWCD